MLDRTVDISSFNSFTIIDSCSIFVSISIFLANRALDLCFTGGVLRVFKFSFVVYLLTRWYLMVNSQGNSQGLDRYQEAPDYPQLFSLQLAFPLKGALGYPLW